jgi:outer membrane protein TolC
VSRLAHRHDIVVVEAFARRVPNVDAVYANCSRRGLPARIFAPTGGEAQLSCTAQLRGLVQSRFDVFTRTVARSRASEAMRVARVAGVSCSYLAAARELCTQRVRDACALAIVATRAGQ